MEESTRPEPAATRPPRGRSAATLPAGPAHLADPRAITILTTEHWGLLTARSLVYNEAFARGAMFLTFLSASLVALGFLAGTGAAGAMLPLVAIPILVLDLFVGLATLGRLVDATTEEFVALRGMARLRHAYLEMVPDLAPYLSTATHDDMSSVLQAYGQADDYEPSTLGNAVHGLTTMPGMVMVIDSALLGSVAAAVAIVAGAQAAGALVVGIAAGAAGLGVFAMASIRVFAGVGRRFEARFPVPSAEAATEGQEPGRRNT